MADPVSWFMIEPGWAVADREGARVGSVEAVLGDESLDIFHGLVVAKNALERRSVPADLVGEIVEGQVQLELSAEDVDKLERPS